MTHAAPAPELHEEISNRTRWLAFASVLLAQFMNLIDVTIVNVAVPSLQADLGAAESQIEWVVAGYILVFALLLLPMGRLGDILGRKRLFLIGTAGFTFASALCGLAPSIGTLIAARLIQGAAAAVLMPQVLAIAQTLFAPQHRAGAFSLFGLVAGLASVTGPLLGGLLITADLWGTGWRPIFLINIPIGIIAVAAAWKLVPHMPGQKGLKNDRVGIAIVAAGMLALIYPLIEGRTLGWPIWCFALMAASLPLFIGFVLWQKRQERLGQPQLIPYSLLKAWNFVVGTTMALIYFSALPSLFLVLAMMLQLGFGFDPLQSGLTTVPFPAGVLVGSILSGRLGARWQKERMLAGLVLMFAGIYWLRLIVMATGPALDHWTLLTPLAISGLGLALSIAPMFQTILAGVPVKDAGAGSGALQAVQQAGGALGVAVVSQIFFSELAAEMASGATRSGAFSAAMAKSQVYNLAAYALVALLTLLLRRPAYASAQPQAAPVHGAE